MHAETYKSQCELSPELYSITSPRGPTSPLEGEKQVGFDAQIHPGPPARFTHITVLKNDQEYQLHRANEKIDSAL